MPVLIVDGDLVGFCLLHYKLRVKILFLFLVGQSARCLHIVALDAPSLAGYGLGSLTISILGLTISQIFTIGTGTFTS